MLVIPVGFTDAQFGPSDLAFAKASYEFADEFFGLASRGASGLDVTYAPRDMWVSLPSTADEWSLAGGPYGENNSKYVDTWAITRAVMDAVDPSLDLGSYPVVAVVAPVSGSMILTNRTEAMPAFMHTTPSGALVRGATFGTARVSKESVAHELGHSWLAFEDLYGPVPLPAGQQEWFPRWDFMADRSEMSSWNRFTIGWLPPSLMRCAPAGETTTHYLQMLSDSTSRPLSAMVPLGPERVLVVEARTITQYDYSLPKSGPTVIAYEVDTKFNHHNGPFRLQGEVPISSANRTITTSTHTVTVDALDAKGAIVTVTPR